MMGFEILPIGTEDEDTYDVLTITSPERWKPQRFVQDDSPTLYYDPADEADNPEESYPAKLNHLQVPLDADKDPSKDEETPFSPCWIVNP